MDRIHHPSAPPTPAPVGNFEKCPDCPGNLSPGHVCKPRYGNAHDAASYVRAHDLGDSDPDMDEALRRVRAGWGVCACGKPNIIGHDCDSYSPNGLAALGRLEAATAYLLRDRQTGDAARRELAGAA